MQTKEKNSPSFLNKLFIIISIFYLILGVLFILFPTMNLSYICYGISVALISLGVVLIVKYFVTEAFRDMTNYGFAIGVFLVIAGLCTVIKNEMIANNVQVYIGVCILITAVIKLQNAMALKAIHDRLWVVIMVVALLIALCSVVMIVSPFKEKAVIIVITYATLLFDGVMSLFSYIYLAFRLRKYDAEAIKMEQETEESDHV